MKLRLFILIFLGVAILAVAAYGIFYKIPGRTVSWGNAQATGENVGTFFKNLFTKNDVSIVIFGRAGSGYIAGALVDAILVAHFDPDTNKVDLVSLPRDLWISDDAEQFKINEAFNKNKVPQVMKEIEDMTGLSTNGYVVVDLNTLKQVVDWLGGVDVVLREPAVDWVSGYTLPAGAHHLNGEDAVWLVRNRYNRQGDFFRESNQHQVLGSILTKFQGLDKEQKNSFLKTFIFKGSFLQNVQVDLARLTPYLFGTDVSRIRFKSIVLDFTTKLFTTTAIPYQTAATTTYISTLIPTAGFENYKDIRNYIGEKMRE